MYIHQLTHVPSFGIVYLFCLNIHWHCSHAMNTCMECTQFNLVLSKHVYLIRFINLGYIRKKSMNHFSIIHFSICPHCCIMKWCHPYLLRNNLVNKMTVHVLAYSHELMEGVPHASLMNNLIIIGVMVFT